MELILLLLSFLSLSSTTSNAADPVLDSHGNALQRGQLYYARSIFRGVLAGGLTVESLNWSCPLYVATSLDHGLPLKFLPENEKEDTVLQGSTLNIKFSEVLTRCPESTMWRYERSTNYVRTGGKPSMSPGPDFSRFPITKGKAPSFGYHIRICPCSVVAGPACLLACIGELGVVGGEVKGALGINSNNPLAVIFVKKENGGVASSVLRSKA